MKRRKFNGYQHVSKTKLKVLDAIGTYWKQEEINKLINRFSRGVPVDHMCRFHRRDVGGIIGRLTHLGLIKPDNVNQCHVRQVMFSDGHIGFDTSVFMTFAEVKTAKARVLVWIDQKMDRMNKVVV